MECVIESEVQEKAATELTPELRQAYVDAIEILFAGVIEADTGQISDDVIHDVDKMLVEISKCSEKISSLGFDLLYKVTLCSVIGKVIENLILRYSTNLVVKKTLKEWVIALSSNYQFSPCLNAARINWKSKVEIDLLGI